MKSEWPLVRIIDLQASQKWALNGGPFGSKLVTRDYVSFGVPVIRGINLPINSRFHMDDFVYVSEEKADELLPNNAHPGDVIFTQRGTLGQVGIIPFSSPFKRFVISQSQMKITVDITKINPFWLYYAFRNPSTQQTLINRASSSGVPHINLETLRQFRIALPPYPIQRKIPAILSAYDDLIENNLRRIKILEEIAQTLYREWFVKFRFPGHQKVKMGNSPLGKVPEGWVLGKIGDLVKICSGFAFKSNTFVDSSKYKVVTIKNVKDGVFIDDCGSHVEEIPRNMPEHCFLHTGDILLSLTGNVGRTCLVFGDDFLLNQRVAKLLPHTAMNRGFIYFMFRQDEMRTKLELISIGVAQQNLSPVLMGNMESFITPDHVLVEFADFAEPICEKIVSLNLQNRNLRSTRDLLLPRLISGKLDVSELDIKTGRNDPSPLAGEGWDGGNG